MDGVEFASDPATATLVHTNASRQQSQIDLNTQKTRTHTPKKKHIKRSQQKRLRFVESEHEQTQFDAVDDDRTAIEIGITAPGALKAGRTAVGREVEVADFFQFAFVDAAHVQNAQSGAIVRLVRILAPRSETLTPPRTTDTCVRVFLT